MDQPVLGQPSRNDALLRETVESIDCHYVVFDSDRRLIDCDESYRRLHQSTFDRLGMNIRYDDLMEALIARTMPAASAEEQAAELKRRIDLHERAGLEPDFERGYPMGKTIRVRKRRLSGGEVAGVAMDVTGVSQRARAISISEARYRALVDAAPVGIWHLDSGGRTLFGNARLAALLGGKLPAQFSDQPLHRVDATEWDGPFGFPSGLEVEAVIPASGRSRRVHVLVCASPWFSGADEETLGTVLTLLDITPLKAAQARAEHLAWHDPLTGLANRSQYQYALDGLQTLGGEATLMLVDLDRFKEANDRHGHAAGDAVLCETAIRLRAAVRGSDLVCRLGGDEFAVLVRGIHTDERAARMANLLADQLSRPTRSGGLDIGMSASIGFARFPGDADTTEALQRAADLALYAAKNAGRNRAIRFEPALRQARERDLLVSKELAKAIGNNGLCLAWQPQVILPGRKLRSAEALVRWPNSPFNGTLATPGQFLGVAQEAGLMQALDAWVLEAVLRQAQAWRGNPAAPGIVALNISAGLLADSTFPGQVASLLLKYGIPAPTLEIEVPESLAARDLDAVAPVLEELAMMGVRLALDDFGGGLSSLSHLVRLPVDLVKLDRSIVAGLPAERERVLLRAVMSLADGLSIPVLAEGVETEAQAFALRREGCMLMQGYLFGRPVPPELLVPAPQPGATPDERPDDALIPAGPPGGMDVRPRSIAPGIAAPPT